MTPLKTKLGFPCFFGIFLVEETVEINLPDIFGKQFTQQINLKLMRKMQKKNN